MSKVNPRMVKLDQCTFEQALYVRNRGFEEYFSDMTTTMESMLKGFINNSISPKHSIVAFDGEKPIGFVFVALKEVDGRLFAWNGGTGIVPEYRGKGLAKPLMAEMNSVLIEEKVDVAYLEVVTKNVPAVKAYERMGFKICDEIVGLSLKKTPSDAFEPDSTVGSIEQVHPYHVAQLPYYKAEAAWDCQWHNIAQKGGQAIVVKDDQGEIQGYALYSERYGGDGTLEAITLYQLEISPTCQSVQLFTQKLLHTIFKPGVHAKSRTVTNFSSAHPNALELLYSAGFEKSYEQYLMRWTEE